MTGLCWIRKTIKSLHAPRKRRAQTSFYPRVMRFYVLSQPKCIENPTTTATTSRGVSLFSLKYISARTSFESMKLVFWGFLRRQNTSSGSAGASFSFLFVIKRESVWDFVLFSVSEKTLKGAGNESSNVNSRARASEAEHLGSLTTDRPRQDLQWKSRKKKKTKLQRISVSIL